MPVPSVRCRCTILDLFVIFSVMFSWAVCSSTMIVHFSAKLLTTVMEINLDTNEPSLWDLNLPLLKGQTTIDDDSILHGIWPRIITSIESFIGTSYQPAMVVEDNQNILCKRVYLEIEDDMKTKSGYRWAFHTSVEKWINKIERTKS